MYDFSKFCCLVYEDGVMEGYNRHKIIDKSGVEIWAEYLLGECGRDRVMVLNFDSQGNELPDAVVYVKGNETKK